jgi:predicted oxidoreductase (fatty acid repression mutant protein)
MEILLNLKMKCWNSTFNAQGLRVIIVVVQVEQWKLYVAAVEALRKKEMQDETQSSTKFGGKTSFGSQLFSLVKYSFLIPC